MADRMSHDLSLVKFEDFTVIECGIHTWIYTEGRTYKYDDIEKAEVILDVGACYGSFALLASKHDIPVYCLEPINEDILRANLLINKISNVRIIPFAIGSPCVLKLDFNDMVRIVVRTPFSEVIKPFKGKRIFLKCDCEGGEWSLTPEDFEGVYRAEFEFHSDFLQDEEIKKDQVVNLLEFLQSKYYIHINGHGGFVRSDDSPNDKNITCSLYDKTEYPTIAKESGNLIGFFSRVKDTHKFLWSSSKRSLIDV